MTNFLSHLVQRTLSASPALMPRLPNPYEGWREPVEARTGDGGEEAIAVLDASREQIPPRTQAPFLQSPQRVPADSPEVRAISNDEGTAAAAGRPPPLPRIDPHAGAFMTMPGAQVPKVENVPADSAPSGAAQPPFGADPTEAVETVAQIRWPAIVSPTASPAPYEDALPTRSDDPQLHAIFETPATQLIERAIPRVADDPSPSQEPLAAPVGASQINQPVPPRRGLLVEPPAPPRSAAQQARDHKQPPSSAQAAAAPSVHVTIGRIELRAAAPAPAPARARPGASRPELSLDDYLERRAKQGRP